MNTRMITTLPSPAISAYQSQAVTWTDEMLVREIVEQDRPELFGLLYDRYLQKVYRKAYSFVHDQDLAQDLAQDIMVKVYRQLHKFGGKSRFSTWLYAISYNFCVEYYRKHKKLHLQPLDTKYDLSEEVEDNEWMDGRCKQLKLALERISSEDKTILLMKYQQDLSIKELTERLNISDSAAKMRLARARQRVKELIQEKELQAA